MMLALTSAESYWPDHVSSLGRPTAHCKIEQQREKARGQGFWCREIARAKTPGFNLHSGREE